MFCAHFTLICNYRVSIYHCKHWFLTNKVLHTSDFVNSELFYLPLFYLNWYFPGHIRMAEEKLKVAKAGETKESLEIVIVTHIDHYSVKSL